MKTIILCLFTLISVFSTPTYAQDSMTANTQYFDISMQRDAQSAWDKSITYSVLVTPKIDSPKTQIIWDSPTLIEITPKHEEFVDMYRDQTYSFKAKIKAKKEGNYEISVNLIAWQHDTNYTNSVSDIITFNNNLLAIPIDPGYTYGNIAKMLFIALFCGIGIWGAIIGSKRAFKIIKRWLTPPI